MAAFAVVLGGSRSLGAGALPLVSSVVARLAAAGAARWSVGCCVGGDALALAALRSAGLAPAVSVFAVGGPVAGGSCAGFWAGSALPGVRAAVAAGARPVWWAGGSASVPLRLRLARRSGLCVRSVVGAPRSAVGVWFLASPASLGSVSAARLAASLGVPVFVFCVGFAPALLAPLCAGGSWVPVASGPLAGALRWVRR